MAHVGAWELIARRPDPRPGTRWPAGRWRAQHRADDGHVPEHAPEATIERVDVPHHEEAERVRREIRALERLDHPGFVRVLESGLDDGRPWFAFAPLVGPTLADRVRDLWPAPPEDEARALIDVLSLFRALASTLAWLHGEGELHGDLTVHDVLVREGDEPVIVTFDHGARADRWAGLMPTRRADDDVRALGAMLDWALTGRTEGSPPGGGAASLPASFHAWLAKLRSGERAPDAFDVVGTLASLGAVDRWGDRAPAARARAPLPGVANERVTLEPDAFGARLDAWLGRPAPPALAAFLLRRTHGNAEELFEWLRTAIALGWLERDRLGAWRWRGEPGLPDDAAPYERAALPSGTHALVHRRLVALPPAALAVAEAAAIAEGDADERVLLEVAELDRSSGDGPLRELVRRGVFARVEGGTGRWRFAEAILLEVLREAIPKPRRRQLHAFLADAMERLDATNGARIADHWRGARELRSAARAYRAASEAAEARGEFAEADRLRSLGEACEKERADAERRHEARG